MVDAFDLIDDAATQRLVGKDGAGGDVARGNGVQMGFDQRHVFGAQRGQRRAEGSACRRHARADMGEQRVRVFCRRHGRAFIVQKIDVHARRRDPEHTMEAGGLIAGGVMQPAREEICFGGRRFGASHHCVHPLQTAVARLVRIGAIPGAGIQQSGNVRAVRFPLGQCLGPAPLQPGVDLGFHQFQKAVAVGMTRKRARFGKGVGRRQYAEEQRQQRGARRVRMRSGFRHAGPPGRDREATG